MRLNLGCGGDRREGWFGVDRAPGPAVDLVYDLDRGPWLPWGDRSVSRILARDVFEHVADPILFMTQCWRILEWGAPLFIKTPHYLHRDAYTDPTHKRFPTEHTFDYWIPGRQLYRLHGAAYGPAWFQAGPMQVQDGAIQVTLFKTAQDGRQYFDPAMFERVYLRELGQVAQGPAEIQGHDVAAGEGEAVDFDGSGGDESMAEGE